MTTTEFSNQFDILYDNIASQGAPGIDLYEKSVYLTKSQLELIKSYYTTLGNKYQKGFESSEKRRFDLDELILNHISTQQIPSENGISNNSQFFRIPNNVFLIINEQAYLNVSDCNFDNSDQRVETYIDVKPKTHDEYNIQKDNPFKKPNKNKVWRLNYNTQQGTRNVELISEYPVIKYKLRYLKYPKPIILTDLTSGEFTGLGLSIDGETSEQTCELNEHIHREILDRAVELATRDYKENNLSNKIQTNLRNE